MKHLRTIMRNAWAIAREAQRRFGGKVREFFALSLKQAWDEHRAAVSTSTTAKAPATIRSDERSLIASLGANPDRKARKAAVGILQKLLHDGRILGASIQSLAREVIKRRKANSEQMSVLMGAIA